MYFTLYMRHLITQLLQAKINKNDLKLIDMLFIVNKGKIQSLLAKSVYTFRAKEKRKARGMALIVLFPILA